jgi:hypothetical protein
VARLAPDAQRRAAAIDADFTMTSFERQYADVLARAAMIDADRVGAHDMAHIFQRSGLARFYRRPFRLHRHFRYPAA